MDGDPGDEPRRLAELRGASRLLVDATLGATDLVESVHHTLSGVTPSFGPSLGGPSLGGPPRVRRTRGLTGAIYRSIRGATWVTGWGLEAVFDRVALARPDAARASRAAESLVESPRREAARAVLNGVVGDHLHATRNPLAIPMRLRVDGLAVSLDRTSLAERFPDATGRLVVKVHGLCRNDLQWRCAGHDHGDALREAGHTTLSLHYNTGRPIAANGRALAHRLEQLVSAWPTPILDLVLLGHSMGGLVMRSACHVAESEGLDWLTALEAMVFLGTPHHGAPLERAGHWVDRILALSPYSAPFARLGEIRSAGIRDLRHGTLLDIQDAPAARHVPLPNGVRCFAIAATRREAELGDSPLPGDGLVPLASALGQHRDPSRCLEFPADRRSIVYGADHFDLLARQEVGERIVDWLADG